MNTNIKNVIHIVSLGLEERISKTSDSMGEVGDKVSNEQQVAAYRAIKNDPGAWLELARQHGVEKVENYRKEMDRREKLSNANRTPV